VGKEITPHSAASACFRPHLQLPESLARKIARQLSLYSSAHAMLMSMVIMILITSLFLILIVESEGRDGLNILITSVPQRGHLNPKLYLT